MKRINPDKYYDIKLKSYSMLSRFDREGPMSLIKPFEPSLAMNLGSLVDDMVTNKEQVDDMYAVSTAKEPTASLLTLFLELKKDINTFAPEGTLNVTEVFRLAKELKLWCSIKKDDTYINKFNTKEFVSYVSQYYNFIGKTVVDQETWALAEKMAGALKNDKIVGPLFNAEEGEVLFQLSLQFGEFEDLKARLDMVVIDHENKIIRPYDLKTTGVPLEEFEKSFHRFRYYIQLSMYTDAVKEWRDARYPSYEVDMMHDIVISSQEPDNPILFKVNEAWLDAAKYGFYSGNYYNRGWVELAAEVDWHREHKEYKRGRRQVEDGFLTIDFKGRIA